MSNHLFRVKGEELLHLPYWCPPTTQEKDVMTNWAQQLNHSPESKESPIPGSKAASAATEMYFM